MKEAKKKKKLETYIDDSISASGAFFVYLITGFFLVVGFWVVCNIYSVDLISDPSLTLRLLWIIEFPIVVIIFSLFRRNPEKCSYFRAVGRSILGLANIRGSHKCFRSSCFGGTYWITISTKNNSLVLSNVCFHDCTSNCSFWCIMDKLASCVRFTKTKWKYRIYDVDSSIWSNYWRMVWSLAYAT